MLLAIHSYSTVATPEGASAWHQALVASPVRLRLAGEHGHVDPKYTGAMLGADLRLQPRRPPNPNRRS